MQNVTLYLTITVCQVHIRGPVRLRGEPRLRRGRVGRPRRRHQRRRTSRGGSQRGQEGSDSRDHRDVS